jgi:outer membrane biogenesis lipoprotein LolB
MKRTRFVACAFAAALLAGCTVKKGENAEGEKTIDVEPAKIKVGTDTATVKVPDIDIVPTDSGADTTTTR